MYTSRALRHTSDTPTHRTINIPLTLTHLPPHPLTRHRACGLSRRVLSYGATAAAWRYTLSSHLVKPLDTFTIPPPLASRHPYLPPLMPLSTTLDALLTPRQTPLNTPIYTSILHHALLSPLPSIITSPWPYVRPSPILNESIRTRTRASTRGRIRLAIL